LRKLLYILTAGVAAPVAFGPLVARATLFAPCASGVGGKVSLTTCAVGNSTSVGPFLVGSVPMMTPEPNATTVTQVAIGSDTIAAGLAIDSSMWAGGETLAMDYPQLCSSQYGKTGCFREDRDGRIVNTYESTADLNWLSENFGMVFDFPVSQTQTTPML
jgi:hypothetical protein